MSAASRIRHSLLGKAARKAIHLIFHAQHPGPDAVAYELPQGGRIWLYPEGQIAEFLAFPRLFERTELALAASFIKSGMTVMDIGANIGLYSILAAKLVGPSGSVWAFEPSNESAARLERNLLLNNCTSVGVYRLALSDTPNTSRALDSDPGFGDAYRYLRPDAGSKGGSNSELVAVTTLDAWTAANGIGQIDFLKVDIEGGEYRMFRGARELLAANPKVVIMFECEADWCARARCRPSDVFDLLRSLGFDLYSWDGRSGRWDDGPLSLARSGMFWATRDRSILPILNRQV